MPSFFYDILAHPGTTLSIVLCMYLHKQFITRNLEFKDVAFQYTALVLRGEYWRALSASFYHASFIHFLLNANALWMSRAVEDSLGGLLPFLRTSLLLLLLSTAVQLLLLHILIHVWDRQDYLTRYSIGYSCVAFALATMLALTHPMQPFSFFIFSFPAWSAPLFNLFITKFFIRNSSLVGHLSGIVAGLLVKLGLFSWVSNYEFLSFVFWVGMWRLRSEGSWPFRDYPTALLLVQPPPSAAPVSLSLPPSPSSSSSSSLSSSPAPAPPSLPILPVASVDMAFSLASPQVYAQQRNPLDSVVVSDVLRLPQTSPVASMPGFEPLRNVEARRH